MLNKTAFANSVTLVAVIFYVVFYLINLILPSAFKFIYNAQFLGADVASLFPSRLSFGNFIGILVVLVITAWIFGYLWALLYNKFEK